MDTFGLPLSIAMDTIEKYGLRVATDIFVYDAIVAGWSFEKAVVVVWEAWADKYGPRKAGELREILECECKKKIAGGILETHRISSIR